MASPHEIQTKLENIVDRMSEQMEAYKKTGHYETLFHVKKMFLLKKPLEYLPRKFNDAKLWKQFQATMFKHRFVAKHAYICNFCNKYHKTSSDCLECSLGEQIHNHENYGKNSPRGGMIPQEYSHYQYNECQKRPLNREEKHEVAHVNRLIQLKNCKLLDVATRDQIKRYMDLRLNDTNKFYVQLYARHLVGGQGFERNLRCYSMEDLYIDLDIENAFPSITSQLSKKLKLPKCKNLTEYVRKRDTILQKYGLNKKSVLEALNKSYEVPSHPFIKSIHKFIYETFLPPFKEMPEFQELWAITKKNKNDGNRDGSFYSKVLQYHENIILGEMETFLESSGYEVPVLVFDGVQVLRNEKNLPVDQTLINNLQQHVNKTTGLLHRHQRKANELRDQLAKNAILHRSHDAVARFLIVLWRDDFYYKNKVWWYFSSHRWTCDSGEFFQHRLLTELMPLLEEKTKWKSHQSDERLIDKLEFRNGKPNDYCLLQIGYDYIEYDPHDETTVRLESQIDKVLPIPEKKEYVMKTFASSLGCNHNDKFNIMVGPGAQGKSFLVGLMTESMDVYATSWNSSILVNDFNGDKANPELADGKYKRFIEIQENKKEKALNMENVKKLTGYDPVRARNLYENGSNFVIKALLFLSVNDLPVILEVDNDPALCDPDKHIYLADEGAKRNRGFQAPYFMSILIKYYKLYKEEGIRTPQSILDDTIKYKRNNDIYQTFFDECCLHAPENKILVEDIHKECIEWAKRQQNKNIRINRNDMLKWLQNYARSQDDITYNKCLRVTKYVDGKGMSKVSTGFQGIKLNRYEMLPQQSYSVCEDSADE
ncbi:uncharacterized protein EV422DRAFT_505507 [Fimicolochytrium jonesii]|uniref:uncharacterized protein n=1 Tax=Fimicolochytrium jonesii TaxID=1396493 RepID=UPI0022FDF4EA|nr:uncharacterized protein EV422DRAFT_505507 [Fimicolochytrium jonesii]KAI8821996.1 hypothetical protein EV422DRAFT_505507 [Fimicolochytrium jonesii]